MTGVNVRKILVEGLVCSICSKKLGFVFKMLSIDDWIKQYVFFVHISICGEEKLLLEGHVISKNQEYVGNSGKHPMVAAGEPAFYPTLCKLMCQPEKFTESELQDFMGVRFCVEKQGLQNCATASCP